MTQTPDSFDHSIPTLTDVVMPGKPEYARVAANAAALEYDATQAADHVRDRVTDLLNNEARALIEARVEEVLRQNAPQLVQALTREIATALESRLKVWVGEAVEEELRRQRES